MQQTSPAAPAATYLNAAYLTPGAVGPFGAEFFNQTGHDHIARAPRPGEPSLPRHLRVLRVIDARRLIVSVLTRTVVNERFRATHDYAEVLIVNCPTAGIGQHAIYAAPAYRVLEPQTVNGKTYPTVEPVRA